VLTTENLGSVQVIGRLLSGRLRGNPRLGFSIVDARDLADLHIRAMTSPEAAGQRFIAAGDFMWIADISRNAAGEAWRASQEGPNPRPAGLCPSVRVVLRPPAEAGYAESRAKAHLHVGQGKASAGLDTATRRTKRDYFYAPHSFDYRMFDGLGGELLHEGCSYHT
jgi:nucleoside-diphosphate-sugar epimerase